MDHGSALMSADLSAAALRLHGCADKPRSVLPVASRTIGLEILFILVIQGLGGCAGFEPQPISPAEHAAALQAHSLTDPSLRAFVEENLPYDPTREGSFSWNLNALMLAAFYFHPELDVARAQWAVAEAARRTADQRPGAAIAITPGRNATTDTPSPRLLIANADVTFETAGKRGYRVAQASELAEAARLNIGTVAWQVYSRVRSDSLALYGALESESLLRQQQQIHAENLRIVEGQYRAGAVSAFELTQARLAADSARLALRDAERRESEARARLSGAIGVPVEALGDAVLSFEMFAALPSVASPAEARRQALLSRPDVLSALSEYAASQSALQLEVARQYPDLRLGPGYEYDQGDEKWSLGLSVTLPAGRNRGPIAAAQARRVEAAARFDALQASVLREIDLGVAAFGSAKRKWADSNAMLSDLNRQATLARGMLEAGATSRSDLTALRLQLSSAAIARLDALLEAQQAAGQLEDAVRKPLGLPSEVWEQAPQAREFREGSSSR